MQGYKKDPVKFLERNLYFRGDANIKGIFSNLKEKFNLYDEVVLTGGSAGGRAVL